MSDVKKGDYLTRELLAKRWKVTGRTIQMWVKAKKIPLPKRFSHKVVRWEISKIVAFEAANPDFLTYLGLK